MFFKDGRLISKRATDGYLESCGVKPFLESRFSDIPKDLFSYKEVLLRIFYYIEKRPVCKVCGKQVTLKGCSYKIFNYYCSNECSHKSELVKEKQKRTNLERYGSEFPMCSKEIQDKAKKISLERYGSENLRSSKEISKEISEKIEKTNLKKYGCKCVFSSKEVHNKVLKTNLSKFGSNSPLGNLEIKGKETLISKYGVDNPVKVSEVQDKIFNTYKKNSIFRSSYPEKVLYSLLKDLFPSIQYQVKGSKDTYPFVADFHLEEFDLWIEYHGSMFHNGHPFTNSENDKQILESIKSKDDGQHPRYKEQIKTWTIRDAKKLEIAKQNHLNLLVLYPSWFKLWLQFLGHKSQEELLEEAKKDFILEFKHVSNKQLIIF